MATALDTTLTRKEFQNWLKGALAVIFAKEGLTEFVQNEISDFQRDLLQSVFIQNGVSPGTICNSCTTSNVLQCPTPNHCAKDRRCQAHDKTKPTKLPNRPCPNRLCNAIKDAIRREHKFLQPSWKNTDATRWCSDAFEMAKCFMPPEGYSDKKSLPETDFNGTLSVIINNKRFQNKLAAQLSVEPNVCSRAREVGRIIRHSADYLLSDHELARCIDALKDLLRDPKCLQHDKNAQDALGKLDKLQNNTLVIDVGDLTKALDDNIRESIAKEHREAIQAIQEHLCKVRTDSVAALEEIIVSKKLSVLEEIQKKGDEVIKRLDQHDSTRVDKPIHTNDDQVLKDLQEDLVEYYIDTENIIPVSLSVEECTAPIMDLYVQPPLSAFNKPNAFGLCKKPPEKTPIKSYKQLFFNNKNNLYRKIYITGDAGMGKTSLSQKLTMTWCQAKIPEKQISDKFHEDELEVMQCFELLFFLHLREYQDANICLLDDMIYDMVSKSTSKNHQYSKKFLQEMLHQKNCLIVLDGLDEWRHPENCSRPSGVPHNNHPNSCTVLTTSRTWKMSTLALPPSQIDQHVEISELDVDTSDKIKNNVLQVLRAYNESEANFYQNRIACFNKTVSAVKFGDIILIPYILLQMFFLWLDGLSIGRSKCEIYCNVIEMTIERGLKRKDVPVIPIRTVQNVDVPKCMENNKLCKHYISLVFKLAELAFFTLFIVVKESRLFIDAETVSKYLSKQELDFCLKIGILKQNKDKSLFTRRSFKIYFQHKSVQEFYAALHISSHWENQLLKTTFEGVCTSLSSILEMSNVFVFVCGLNPKVYSSISLYLQNVVACDHVTYRYRNTIDYDDEKESLQSYQSMQVSCLKESVNNENKLFAICLQDILLDEVELLDDDLTPLKTIINYNRCRLKSVYVKIDTVESKTLSLLHTVLSLPKEICPLNTLRVMSSKPCSSTQCKLLVDILNKQSFTLNSLELGGNFLFRTANFFPLFYKVCKRRSFDVQNTCMDLQELSLQDITFPENDYAHFFTLIGCLKTIRQLKLASITCSYSRPRRVHLNLSKFRKLEKLHLEDLSLSVLRVNAAYLRYFYIEYINMTNTAEVSLLGDIREAPFLSCLYLEGFKFAGAVAKTIPTLTKLTKLTLVNLNIGEDKVNISDEMTRIKHVELAWIKMTYFSWRELFFRIITLPQSVTVEVKSCEAITKNWNALLNEIESTFFVVMIEDFSVTDSLRASFTLKSVKNR